MRTWLVLVAVAGLHAQDPAEIVRKSVEKDARSFELRKDYTYTEREEDHEYDGKGKLKRTESETHEILMLAGRPYERLVAKMDKPLSPKEEKHEQEKLDRELAKRQKESAGEKAKQEKERLEERRFVREVPNAYNLKLVGTELVSGKPAWAIEAEPKPNYKPVIPRTDVLKKIRAKVWIDQQDYQWVKVDAEVIDTLSFGLALVRVMKGAKLHFEQTRVNDEIWLPSLFTASANARFGYLMKMSGDARVTYSDYKKFQTDSRIVSVEEK
jgi:hypothetical protein